jgi:uncharacterized protein (DUF885 family)
LFILLAIIKIECLNGVTMSIPLFAYAAERKLCMKFKKITALALAFLLAGCTASGGSVSNDSTLQDNTASIIESASQDNSEFTDFIEQYVIDYAQLSYTTCHQYFADPAKYGIDISKAPITLGDFEEDDEYDALAEQTSKKLETFTYSDLSRTQQDIYDQLKWELDLYEKSNKEDYKYINNIWSSLSSVPDVLVTYFSEYELRSEDDIAPLIVLIQDVPNYVDSALSYSKKQADMDLLYFDYDGIQETIQTVLDTKDESAVTSELMVEVENLGLSEEKTAQYEEQITQALNENFFPAYETMKSGLEALKDEVQEPTGLANLPNGKDYYQLLVQDSTGTDEDAALVKTNLNNGLNSIVSQYYALSTSNPNAITASENLSTGFSSVQEIMDYLDENYTRSFPEVDEMHYNLQALSDEQSQDGIVAYFMVPCIGNTSDYQIRYNERDYGKDTTDPDLYGTLAHEGIPGHMYQAQYDSEHLTYAIQYMFDNSGYSEGYATYANYMALRWLDLDADAIEAYIMNDLYSGLLVCAMDVDINYYGMSRSEFAEEYGDGYDDLYTMLADNPSVYLSYYYGYYTIAMLRTQAKESLGDNFDDVSFNAALLSGGAVNFDIKERYIDEYIQANTGEKV